jgi:hypothetical protein
MNNIQLHQENIFSQKDGKLIWKNEPDPLVLQDSNDSIRSILKRIETKQSDNRDFLESTLVNFLKILE